jgi:hypothetical protein
MPFRDGAQGRQGPTAPIEVELGANSASQLYADLSGRGIIGVFAQTFMVLPRDVHVQLIISFPDRNSIRAGGVVHFLRTGGPDQLPGLGVAFTEISEDDRAELRRFAASVRPPMLYDE